MEFLDTHCISPDILRFDDFPAFFAKRKASLLSIVTEAMGKPAIDSNEPVADDQMDEDTEDA